MVIVLIGYRGSGKTTAGRLLAERLGKAFVDCDEAIVAREGKSIREIFLTRGEEAFRKAEMEAISDLASRTECVIALGGGAILREENRRALAGHKIVYLRCEAGELLRRIKADPASSDNRPNLTNLGGEIEEIQALVRQREPIYRAAMSAELDVTHLTPLEVAEHLERLIT
ncbi:MAG: shikimate kinase [Tepidisphaeraceae bacterium]|jgi:shikimate kinase